MIGSDTSMMNKSYVVGTGAGHVYLAVPFARYFRRPAYGSFINCLGCYATEARRTLREQVISSFYLKRMLNIRIC